MKKFKIHLLLKGGHSIWCFEADGTGEKDVEDIERDICVHIDDDYRLVYFNEVTCDTKVHIIPSMIVAFSVYEVITE